MMGDFKRPSSLARDFKTVLYVVAHLKTPFLLEKISYIENVKLLLNEFDCNSDKLLKIFSLSIYLNSVL